MKTTPPRMTGCPPIRVTREQIAPHIEETRAAFLDAYKKLVEIPSISSLPAHRPDIDRTAEFAAQFLRDRGALVKVVRTSGHPVVFGRFHTRDDVPTVGIYNHLDVQPATAGKEGWTTDPFQFTERDGVFYGRGTTDCKGPAVTAVWGTWIARQLGMAPNVEVFWELEEETGSRNFREFLNAERANIRSKVVIVSDTIWLRAGKPVISRGLRGLVAFKLKLKSGEKEVHSGLAGGSVRNPLLELATIAARCGDARTGRVTIPGFRQTWKPLSRKEVAGFVEAGFRTEDFQAAHGLTRLFSTDPAQIAERIWGKPTFEVHGLVGGYVGEGFRSGIPADGELRLSMRLVPGQDPKEIQDLFTRYVRQLNPDVEVIPLAALPASNSDMTLPEIDALKNALHFGFGVRPSYAREGGSIGAVPQFQSELGLPVAFMGLSLPEDSYHGPNESFRWSQMEGGIYSYVALLDQIARLRR